MSGDGSPATPAVAERPRRRFRLRTLFIAVAVVGLLAWLVGYVVVPRIRWGALTNLDASDGLILYSIDGTDGNDPDQAARNDPNKFYGYPVLGKIEIEGPLDREAVIVALKDAVARRPTGFAHCWWPRHGIRALANDETVDLVICFQCDRLRIYRNGIDCETEQLSNSAAGVLNKYLQNAGIPLAPGAGIGRRGEF